jgi:hypothetical protein
VRLTRRGLLASAAGVAVGGAAVGVGLESAGGGAPPADPVPFGPQRAGLPARQHAWTATLARDDDGNPIAPRFDRLLFYDLQGVPAPAHARALEAVPGIRGSLELGAGLDWRETRTGFVGTGLPARHQDVGGIPPGNPVPASSPLFMGFKSGLLKNQATEDYVTIADGPFAGGTTMQVSYMRLRLDSWYGSLDESGRVARMYSPETTPEQVKHFTTDAESEPNLINQAIHRYGVIGHSQTSARARRSRTLRSPTRSITGSTSSSSSCAAPITYSPLERSVRTPCSLGAGLSDGRNPDGSK